MKKIQVINGDPVIQKTTILSAGEHVPAVIAYCEVDMVMKKYNTKAQGNEVKEVDYTPALRRRVLRDIIRCYGSQPVLCIDKLEEFDLLILDNIYNKLADSLGLKETEISNQWVDETFNKFCLTRLGFKKVLPNE